MYAILLSIFISLMLRILFVDDVSTLAFTLHLIIGRIHLLHNRYLLHPLRWLFFHFGYLTCLDIIATIFVCRFISFQETLIIHCFVNGGIFYCILTVYGFFLLWLSTWLFLNSSVFSYFSYLQDA